MNLHNVYIKTNKDWDYENKVKYGYVNGIKENLINRLHNSSEEHSEHSYFTHIFTFYKTKDYILEYKEIDKIISISNIKDIEILYCKKFLLLKQLKRFLVISETKITNEFIHKDGLFLLIDVLKKEFCLLGLELCKEYSIEEIEDINNSKCNIKKVWYEREYQTNIIQYGIDILKKNNIFYLELATGGGKTYIIYKILSHLTPDIIIIFSPRININTQNSNKKYLSLLQNEYIVFNYSICKDFKIFQTNKKIIIVACPQSSNDKIYGIIHEFNLKNICIWFDEAHHTIENWFDKKNTFIHFFLEDKTIIKYRIFTSASPNKKRIEENSNYFGKLYTPIKIKELIELNWLCSINPYIYQTNESEVNICNYNIKHFERLQCHFGFSFHNLRDNAYKLFLEHYTKYKNKETSIKPFLLVGNDYKKDDLNYINLDYNYRCIQVFEETYFSIGYVVNKYSMGYDFSKINFISFSDLRSSYNDIKQCIGRGLRPDGLGKNGKNKDKILTLLLPIFIDTEKENRFTNIEQVLRYIIYDIEYPFDKIKLESNVQNKKAIDINETIYDGEKDMEIMLLDLLRDTKYRWKIHDFVELLKKNNIHSKEEYYSFFKCKKELELPEDIYSYFKDFYWEQTYIKSPYYSKQECIKKILELKDIHNFDMEEQEEPEIYLHSLDPKIPPICLFRFYGGCNNNDFY